jgi:hypothetical protein
MLTTRLLICLGFAGLTTPALCAQFFIVHDPTSKRCAVIEQPTTPGSGAVVVIGDGTSGDRPPTPGSAPVVVGDGAYGDRPTAEADMRKIAACATTGQ